MGHREDRSTDQGSALRRLSVGMLAALSLLLVAFEWRSGSSELRPMVRELGLEDSYDPLPIVLQRKTPAQKAIARERIRTSTAVVVGEPTEPLAVGNPATDPGPTDPVTDPVAFRNMNPPEVPDPGPMPWTGVEQRPYFLSCLDLPRAEIDACTEDGIDRHLQQKFRVPPGMRGEEFTVVTFVIDANGAIGRIACVPKPREEVRQEIERVMRAMPTFVPATQNGRSVAVVYQIPFRVARR